jgi:hypothetical protein
VKTEFTKSKDTGNMLQALEIFVLAFTGMLELFYLMLFTMIK